MKKSYYSNFEIPGGPGKKLIILMLLFLFCFSPLYSVPCGDVDSNGVVNIVDALLVARYYVGLDPQPFDLSVADVDKNGTVTISDALRIARYYAGLLTSLPECPAMPTDPPIGPDTGKPRVIMTTDGEIDDRSSLIRFLMYTCDFEVEGIVPVASRYKTPAQGGEWIETIIDIYTQVLPNLRKHNPDYPDADYLMSKIYVGNENRGDLYVDPPDMEIQDTPGSQLIIDTLLQEDPRPVHVVSWSGANTPAFALYRLQRSYSQKEFERAVSKIRIYCIWYQDGGGQWIEDNIPEATIFEAFGWDNVWDYGSTSGSTNPPEQKSYMTSTWLNEHVKTDHGPLGAYTPQSFVSESDTPSFLHMVNNGLRAHEDYTLGGWGGRAEHTIASKSNYLTDREIREGEGDYTKRKHYWRWLIDAQNDYQARMDWCVAPLYSDANHAPVARVTGSYDVVRGGLGREVSPGETVILDASPSKDPDGDNLSYLWWQYHEADSVSTELTINNGTSGNNVSFTVPDEPGKEIQIILEVKDNGSPPLKGYQRLLFSIN